MCATVINTHTPTFVVISCQLISSYSVSEITFSQYVSALRPPKKRYQSSAGMSIDSDMDEDVWPNSRIFQRRTSLTFPKPLGTRDSFQNRSLQDFSDRIRLTVEEELETRRKKQSIFIPSRSENEVGPSASFEPESNSDSSKDEWKQVMIMNNIASQLKMFPKCDSHSE